jgi:MFS family permease
MPSRTHTTSKPSLWRNRNYLLLQGGQIISSIGNQQQSLALPLLVLALTGSIVQAGIAISLSTIAVLAISPIAGALADRGDRKKTMLICDTGRLLVTLSIPFAYWLHMLTIWQIYIAVTIAGVFGTIFSSANTAALPNVVTPEQLPDALAQTQAAASSVRTFGSLLGGMLYNIAATLPFLVNAISFGASVLSLGLMRGNFQRRQEGSNQSLHRAVAEGFVWLWRQPLIRFLTLVNGADGLRYGAGYLVIIVLAQNLHTSASGVGGIFTSAAIGTLLGNFASGWARKRFRFGTITLSMLWLEALVFPLYAIAPNAVIMGLIAATEEFIGPIYTISLDTYRLVTTPDSMRGRVSSTVQFVVQGAQSLGAIVGGLLIEGIGGRWSAVILGAWLILLAIVTTLNKHVRGASL